MAYILPSMVGCVLLFSGLVKALYSQPFIAHIKRFHLLSGRFIPLVAIILIEMECGIGIALILHVFPAETIPLAFLLITSLTFINYWGFKQGRISDCGCFGGLIWLTPKQSILLNFGYLTTLGFAWMVQIERYNTSWWKVWVLVVTILVSNHLAKGSVKKPIWDFSKLKAGKSWNPDWLKNMNISFEQGIYFLLFLNQHCLDCKKWTQHLTVMAKRPNTPTPISIINSATDEFELHKEYSIGFPIYTVENRIFRLLTQQLPTAVLVENGLIMEKWVDQFPLEFT